MASQIERLIIEDEFHNPRKNQEQGRSFAVNNGIAPICDLDHRVHFDQYGDLDESQLRLAVKHAVIFKHQVNGAEFGGFQLDESLPQKLNLSWFQKNGLMRALALRFKGDFKAVIEFAWPEGFQSEKPELQEEHKQEIPKLDPSTLEFWQELKKDLELVEINRGKPPLNTFLRNFDPDKNKECSWTYKGKYERLLLDFFKKAYSDNNQTLGEYLFWGFAPPAENTEFVDLVSMTRLLMSDKLSVPLSLAKKTVAERLNNPEFWKELQKDISSVDKNSRFSSFLQFFTYRGSHQWSSLGKYQDVYYHLGDLIREDLGQQTEGANPQEPLRIRKNARAQLFYNLAPDETKLLLLAKFPNDFENIGFKSLQETEILSEEVRSLLRNAYFLSIDNRDRILDSLSAYIIAKNSAGNANGLSESGLKSMLEKAIVLLRQDQKIQATRVEIDQLLRPGGLTGNLLQEIKLDGQTPVAEAAKELLETLKESYFAPLVKSVLYKPAALFWSSYLNENPHLNSVLPETFIDFLERYVDEKIIPQASLDNNEELEFFKSQILPRVYKDFAQIAVFAPSIEYFSKSDRENRPKHLFLHQVEGIKTLMEKGCGIVADEPGTGKTVILSLSALNLLKSREFSPENPGRILVVGTKSVIDNWESEIGLHLELQGLDIANINFTSEQEFAESPQALQRRIRKLEYLLKSGKNSRQMVLVNYDLFRNPSFKKILENYNFHSIIVDETHNVKSRFYESISDNNPTNQVAKRTSGLYRYIKNHPEASVFLATSTPFVKELIEPLIMAHLVNAKVVPEEKVMALRSDVVATHKALREVMIRRRKEEIADLPPKETIFAPIDLNSLSDDQKAEFVAVAQELEERNFKSFAKFYSLLSLEGLAKYPWLEEKVKEILSEGRKAVIFTPFVTGENRYTSPISTAKIAEKLRKAGINSVGVLDGSLSEPERLAVQESFKRKDGIKVLVGNYITAGESITLNSPENRATEVILFIGPNSISRYIQATDRIHRFGQREKVTIHIPYVTGDPIKRPEGTFDERVVRRLSEEMAMFGAVIDGLFFVEEKDIYQSIVQAEAAKIKSKVDFKIDLSRKESGSPRRAYGPRILNEDGFDFENDAAFDPRLLSTDEINLGWVKNIKVVYDSPSDNLTNQFYEQARQYSFIDRDDEETANEQERTLFEYFLNGQTLDELRKDETFLATIKPENLEKFVNAANDSHSIKNLIANLNLLLVASIARNYQGRGLEFMDLVQEGSFGLTRAIEKYEPDKGFKFSTYATWWIRQAVTRAAADKGQLVRIPVHMYERIGKVMKLSNEFTITNGSPPNVGELRDLLLSQEGLSESEANSVLKTIQSGVTHVGSLDRLIGEDGESSLSDFVADEKEDTSRLVTEGLEDQDLKSEVERALRRNLSVREREAIRLRFGLDETTERTLEEVGQIMGVTRERVRQIQEKGLAKLRADEGLKTIWWEKDTPSFLYGTSAEQAAIKLGLFDEKESFVEKTASELSRNLQSVLYGRVIKSLSSEEIASAEGLSEGEVEFRFNMARIQIWEGLGQFDRDDLKDLFQRRDIYGEKFRPVLDLTVVRGLFDRRKSRVSKFDSTVFSQFFGVGDVSEALLSRQEVSRSLNITPETVAVSLNKTLQAIGSGRRDEQRAWAQERAQEIIQDAMQKPEIWHKISNREKSLLFTFSRSWSNTMQTRERLSRIFGISEREIDISMKNALKRLSRLMSGRLASDEVETLVINLINQNPDFTYRDLSEAVSKKYTEVNINSVRQAKRRIAAKEKLELQGLSSDAIKAQEAEVESLIGEGLNYWQISRKSGLSLGRVRNIAYQLRRTGRINFSESQDQNTRTQLKNYLNQNQNVETNLSQIARDFGVSRERVRQLYDELKEKPKSPQQKSESLT